MSLDLDTELITDPGKYVTDAAKNLMDLGKNTGKIVIDVENKTGDMAKTVVKTVTSEISVTEAGDYYTDISGARLNSAKDHQDEGIKNSANNVLAEGENTKVRDANARLDAVADKISNDLGVAESDTLIYEGNKLDKDKVMTEDGVNKANAAAIHDKDSQNVMVNAEKADLTDGAAVYSTIYEETYHKEQQTRDEAKGIDETKMTKEEQTAYQAKKESWAKDVRENAADQWKTENDYTNEPKSTQTRATQTQFVSNNQDSLMLDYGNDKAAAVTRADANIYPLLSNSGYSHMAYIIGNPSDGYYYFSQGAAEIPFLNVSNAKGGIDYSPIAGLDTQTGKIKLVVSNNDGKYYFLSDANGNAITYDRYSQIETTPEQDHLAISNAKKQKEDLESGMKLYNALFNNCGQSFLQATDAANVKIPGAIIPKDIYNNVLQNGAVELFNNHSDQNVPVNNGSSSSK